MPVHYVEDYDGKKDKGAAEREQIPMPPEGYDKVERDLPIAKVIDADEERKSAQKSSSAKTKG